MTVPTAHVWHKVSASFGGPTSPLISYFDIRNKLLFVEKNASRLELIRLLGRGIRRFWPPFRVERGDGISFAKALFWAIRSHVRDWARRMHDPLEIAHRRAVRDYVRRRFGDCPPEMRALNEIWVESRQGSQAAGAASRPAQSM
jgi:GT2 family glycosyltransferase